MKKPFKPQSNVKYTQIAFYVIITSIILMAMIQIFLHLGLIAGVLGKSIKTAGHLLKPLIGGFIFAYLLYPLTTMLQKNLLRLNFFQKHRRSSRGIAVIITVFLAFLVIFILLSVVFSAVNSGIRTVHFDDIGNMITEMATNIQGFFRSFSTWLNSLNLDSQYVNDVIDKISKWGITYAQTIGNNMIGSLSRLPSILSNITFIVVFGVYFLLDGEGLKRYWDRVFRSFSENRVYSATHVFLADMNKVFSGYIRGQLLDAIFMFAVISLGLSIAGVRYAVLIGLLTGLGNLIPYVGPFLAYGSSIIVNVIVMDIPKLVISIIIIFIIQTIDGNIVNPKLLSSNVDVHPMLVILALLIGSAAGGLTGMLLAVPIAALIRIEFERLVNWKEKRKETKQAEREAMEALAEEEEDSYNIFDPLS